MLNQEQQGAEGTRLKGFDSLDAKHERQLTAVTGIVGQEVPDGP